MIRLLILSLMAGALLACGAAPAPGTGVKLVEPLVEGEGTWRARYNPPPCLADRPELHAELETPAGWERVALESGSDDADLVAALLGRFDAAPGAFVAVRGVITSRTRTWTGQHASRVFVVQEVDPPTALADEAD